MRPIVRKGRSGWFLSGLRVFRVERNFLNYRQFVTINEGNFLWETQAKHNTIPACSSARRASTSPPCPTTTTTSWIGKAGPTSAARRRDRRLAAQTGTRRRGRRPRGRATSGSCTHHHHLSAGAVLLEGAGYTQRSCASTRLHQNKPQMGKTGQFWRPTNLIKTTAIHRETYSYATGRRVVPAPVYTPLEWRCTTSGRC